MSEHLLDAAGEISGIQVGTGYESVTIGITAALEAARALDAAGLLVTPEHDAAVAARALRDAADKLNRDRRIHDASCGESPAQTKEQAGRDYGVSTGLRQAVRHLDERAAAVERGEP